MPITYPLDFPSILSVSSVTIGTRNAVEQNRSPFTYQQQVYDLGGQMFVVSGTLPLMTKEQAEEYVAFLFKLRGKYGSFLFPIPLSTPRGVATGTPLVKGAGQTGASLIIDGMTPSTTNIFRAGDWINLGTGAGTRAHKILNDANSNGSGEVTLDIWPNLRESPADNASVTITNCKIHLRLDGDRDYSIDTNKHYFLDFAASEAI